MKLHYLALFISSLLLSGCQSEQESAQAKITELEKQLEDGPTTSNAQVVVQAYLDYASRFPEDKEVTPRYLYRAAAVQYRMNRFAGAVELLSQAIRDYYDSPNTPKAAIFLGDIYEEKLRNEENAVTVYQALIRAFPKSEEAKEAIKKSPEGIASLEHRLEMMGNMMFNDSTGRLEYRIANNFIASSELYALLLPGSKEAPAMLYKAAEVARSVRAFDKALGLYEQINQQYPEHEQASRALFMRAFTLDSDLKQLDEARSLYEQFIAEYPEDDFADDAQVLLDNLGKDDEEIIRSFTQDQEEAQQQ